MSGVPPESLAALIRLAFTDNANCTTMSGYVILALACICCSDVALFKSVFLGDVGVAWGSVPLITKHCNDGQSLFVFSLAYHLNLVILLVSLLLDTV